MGLLQTFTYVDRPSSLGQCEWIVVLHSLDILVVTIYKQTLTHTETCEQTADLLSLLLRMSQTVSVDV